ncbi:DciA family protein, partial [Streptomyces sp. NPDC003247]|uniref:DciA family protein n=1 Tax=Streptomyces sp. NPDC003247 TaxID=3364677 RepID=UPI0036BAE6D4
MIRTVRRDGREPMGLGAAIGALVTERAWELPAAGATLRERWAAIAPELAGHVAAVSYDVDSGRLAVCPESSAWATKARLEQTRIIAAANASAGRTVVRALRILAPGAVPGPEPVTSTRSPRPCPPVAAYSGDRLGRLRRALAAHRQADPPSLADPDIAQAIERQTAAMRELSHRAFPETETAPDDELALIERARARRRRQAAATEAAALRRARRERAARQRGLSDAAAVGIDRVRSQALGPRSRSAAFLNGVGPSPRVRGWSHCRAFPSRRESLLPAPAGVVPPPDQGRRLRGSAPPRPSRSCRRRVAPRAGGDGTSELGPLKRMVVRMNGAEGTMIRRVLQVLGEQVGTSMVTAGAAASGRPAPGPRRRPGSPEAQQF